MLIRFEPKELGYVVPPKVEQELYNELWQVIAAKHAQCTTFLLFFFTPEC